MKTTEWRYHRSPNGFSELRTRVTYGVDLAFAARHKQAPYFSITHETEECRAGSGRWIEHSWGASVDTELFPEFQRAERWHLVSTEGPMHYIANAVYWAEIIAGVEKNTTYGPNPREAFASTVVLGALEGDVMPCLIPFGEDPGDLDIDSVRSHVRKSVKAWCEGRLVRLLEAFRADMARIGVEV